MISWENTMQWQRVQPYQPDLISVCSICFCDLFCAAINHQHSWLNTEKLLPTTTGKKWIFASSSIRKTKQTMKLFTPLSHNRFTLSWCSLCVSVNISFLWWHRYLNLTSSLPLWNLFHFVNVSRLDQWISALNLKMVIFFHGGFKQREKAAFLWKFRNRFFHWLCEGALLSVTLGLVHFETFKRKTKRQNYKPCTPKVFDCFDLLIWKHCDQTCFELQLIFLCLFCFFCTCTSQQAFVLLEPEPLWPLKPLVNGLQLRMSIVCLSLSALTLERRRRDGLWLDWCPSSDESEILMCQQGWIMHSPPLPLPPRLVSSRSPLFSSQLPHLKTSLPSRAPPNAHLFFSSYAKDGIIAATVLCHWVNLLLRRGDKLTPASTDLGFAGFSIAFSLETGSKCTQVWQ